MTMEMVIRHDGTHWVVKNEELEIRAESLEEMDRKLGMEVRRRGLIGKGQKLKVFMAFDNSTIPQWIRQYSQHYFNRIVEIAD